MDHSAEHDMAIADAVRASAIEFLRVELKIANTMLDLAESSAEPDARERRCAQAVLARATVQRYLRGGGPAVTLQAEDRDALARDLRALDHRMSSL